MEIYNKVLEMLGVEEGEVFNCIINEKKSDYKYYFENGVLMQTTRGYSSTFNSGFINLINGEWKIYRKTYKDDFLEKFPNASLEDDGTPCVCWEDIYNIGICSIPCERDCKKFWDSNEITIKELF